MPLLAGEAEKAAGKLRSSKSLPSLGRLSGVALRLLPSLRGDFGLSKKNSASSKMVYIVHLIFAQIVTQKEGFLVVSSVSGQVPSNDMR